MKLKRAFKDHGGKMRLEDLRALRFNPTELIEAGFIDRKPPVPFYFLTPEGDLANPDNKAFDAETRAVP